MHLTKIHIVNYRNYEDVHCSFHPEFNLITGLNGKGKTNLIDAIHYLGLTRSYFFSLDTHNYRNDESFFRIDGSFVTDKKAVQIVAKVVKRKAKVFEKNAKKYDKLIEHIGLFPMVMIAPKDQELITQGSDERRRLLNATISQLDSEYLRDLVEYRYVLKQRNKLLKDYNRNRSLDNSLLDIYDEKLVATGTRIHKKRDDYIQYMKPIFMENYRYISSAQEECVFEYKSQINSEDLATLLKSDREKDKMIQRTSSGIHKDDIVFFNEDNMIKHVGSQGQQKSFILALKLAQFDLIKTHTAKKAIILLDDIFDKLDSGRVLQLIQLLKERDLGQIFITDTDAERVKKIFKELKFGFSHFEVESNLVQVIK